MVDSLPTRLHFTLIAPERVLAERSATMVTLPGAEGMLGILPGHAPLITALNPGIVMVEGDDDAIAGTAANIEQIFIGGGFAEVTLEGLTVLASEALPLTELDSAGLTVEQARLTEELALISNEADRAILTQELGLVTAKLQALAAPLAA